MRISMPTIVVDKEYRRRLAIYNDPESPVGTLATREEVRDHHVWNGESECDDIWCETNEQYEKENGVE